MYTLNGFPFNTTEKSDNESDLRENLNAQLDNEDFENVFINDYLKKFKNTCETSESLAESLFLCWVIRSIAK